MKSKTIFLAVVILFFVSNSSYAATASFQGLGHLPGGEYYSLAQGVSADGSVVVGVSDSASGNQAFRWENGVMTGLGDLPGGDFESEAWGVSADGSVVVGRGWSALGMEAFRWENGQMVGLGDLPGFEYGSEARDCSADGSVVVGAGTVFLEFTTGEAFRWEDLNGNGLVDLDEKLDNHPEFGLGDLPGGGFGSCAIDVSADGLIVVGYSFSAMGQEAFRWTQETGMIGLGDLPGGKFYSWAWGVSADGSVVVGESNSALGYEAFIWDADNGMRNLQDVFVNDYGLDLTGWTLDNAFGISDDGLTIVGGGNNPAGYYEGWIATIPEPATVLLLGLGGIFIRKRPRFAQRATQGRRQTIEN